MNALFIVCEYGNTTEYLFAFTTQKYKNFVDILKELGYKDKYILHTAKCTNIKYVHHSEYKKLAKVNLRYPANNILNLEEGIINEITEKGHVIEFIIRACAVCIQCKNHSAVFKTSKKCLFYPCTLSYKNVLYGSETVIF